MATGTSPAPDQIKFNTLSNTSLGLRAGSAGWGFEYKIKVQEPFDFRFVWQTLAPGRFEIETPQGLIGAEAIAPEALSLYRAKGNFQTTGALADWYPWSSPIRFSFGIFRNNSEFEVIETQPQSAFSNHYSANFGNLAYFFGTGWASRNNPHRFSLTLDVGLLAQQPAQVIWIEDNQTRTSSEQARIWSEKKAVQSVLNDYKILPFFMIGLSYQIF